MDETAEEMPGTADDNSTGIPAKGTYYFHPDNVGSISYLTDADGKVVSRMNYTPYGEIIKSKSTGGGLYNKKYTGQAYDGDDSGLMYYNARYYDPMIGRFISADTIIPDAKQSQMFNRYMYVAGNPVKFKDGTGHMPAVAIGAIVGAIVGGIAGGVVAHKAGYSCKDKEFWKSVGKGAALGAAIGATIGLSWTGAGAGASAAAGTGTGATAGTGSAVGAGAATAGTGAAAGAGTVGAGGSVGISLGWGQVAAGSFNAYYSARAGGSMTDIASAYLIGWTAGMFVVGSSPVINGAFTAGLSNYTTQLYNLSIADNKQQGGFSWGSLGMSIAIGGLVGYASANWNLTNFKLADNSIMIESLGTNGYGVKMMAASAIFFENSWFYIGSQDSEMNRDNAFSNIDSF